PCAMPRAPSESRAPHSRAPLQPSAARRRIRDNGKVPWSPPRSQINIKLQPKPLATGPNSVLYSVKCNSAGGAMTIKDLIDSRKDFYCIADDVTVHEAARYLRDKQIRSVGV